MISGLKPYARVQDSGVPWLGEVPTHWEVKRNKLFLHEVNDRSSDGTEELLTVSRYTGVSRRRDRVSGDGELLTNAASLIGYKRVAPGDLVMNIMLAWNGSLGVSAINGIVSPAYCVFRTNNKVESRFLHYLLRTPLFTGVFKTASTGVVDSRLRLYPDAFLRLPSLLPPPAEQAAIVRFLDHATQRIGKAIRAKQKLIKLLEEQKQAIIHRAVTRGLDPNVRFKPSGDEWLGNVPARWEVVKLGRYFRCRSGSTPDRGAGGFYCGNIPWIKTGELLDANVDSASELITEAAVRAASLSLLPVDTVLVAMYGQGKTRGRTGLLKIAATVNQACLAILPNVRKALPEYLQLLLVSQYARLRFISNARNATQPNLNANLVKGLRIVLAPLDEQAQILKTVRSDVRNIDAAIKLTEQQISLLRAYRTRLIADVVTGKLDVREAAAGLPEEVSDVGTADAAEAWSDEGAAESEEMDDTAVEEAEA